jgi:hypothetical protein
MGHATTTRGIQLRIVRRRVAKAFLARFNKTEAVRYDVRE